MNKHSLSFLLIAGLLAGCANQPGSQAAGVTNPIGTIAPSGGYSYPLVDTGQSRCYADDDEIDCASGAYAGQDAQYAGNMPRYRDNGDGTVSDLVTGLMWQQDPGAKMTADQAAAGADSFQLAGYEDWRLPGIKELYSLILFDGTDVSGCQAGTTCPVTPFIDTRYFHFSYGDPAAGERTIDAQFASASRYVSTTMYGNPTMFGVNFADGRIKGYGTAPMPGTDSSKTFTVLYVRGNPAYGQNDFRDNGDGTIADLATGLTWMTADSGTGMDWPSALAYCEALDLGGSSDWRLPDAKELQSIVDYTRSPETTDSAAIDPLFSATAITNEAGQMDFPYYWSSTTHADANGGGRYAVYLAFGRAMGYMNSWVDVHGAGAQRSDPKSGSAADFPTGHGPQGDAVRIQNYVRCVRGGASYQESGSQGLGRPDQPVESTGVDQANSPASGRDGTLPPLEAIQACSASSVGSDCSFQVPAGTLSGTCQLIAQALACVPDQRR